MDFLYRFRDFISGPPALILAFIVMTTPITKVIEKMMKDDFEQEVILKDPPPPPPPPKEEPKEVKPEPKEVAPVPQVPDVITKESVVTEVKPPVPEPTRELPKSDAPPAPVQTGPTVAQIEAGYSGIILRYLESIKRYPGGREARTQRPTGKVYLWVEVGRDGSMKDAGVIKSSFSQILDNAALATARNGQYPPFPASAFPGESSHRFNVTLEYNFNNE